MIQVELAPGVRLWATALQSLARQKALQALAIDVIAALDALEAKYHLDCRCPCRECVEVH